jgi:hypothetical protein
MTAPRSQMVVEWRANARSGFSIPDGGQGGGAQPPADLLPSSRSAAALAAAAFAVER